MTQLTMREWTVLTFVQDYWRRCGSPPSVPEVRFGCGLGSRQDALQALTRLEDEGLVSLKFLKRLSDMGAVWRVHLCHAPVVVGVEP
jgi:SOS-response transcriptional repressor LexA